MNRAVLESAAGRSIRYLTELDQRRVAPTEEAVSALQQLDGELPAGPSDPEAVLERLDLLGSPATIASAGGRYFGFVIGGALPAALAANWLAGAWDQNAVMAATSPAAAKIEEIAIRWLLEILDLPREAGGGLVDSDTQAIFCGLAAARHALLAGEGWDVEGQGLFGAPPITVVVSEEAHMTVHKCLGLLGLGRERVVRVPTDARPHARGRAAAP